MSGDALAERQERLISRLAHVHDSTLLDAIERLLDERAVPMELVPLQDDEMEAILAELLASD